MGYSIAAVHNRLNANNKSKKYKVNIRFTLDRKPMYLEIPGFPRLEKVHWHDSRRQVKNTHPQAWELNQILRTNMEALEGFVIKSMADGTPLSLDSVRRFHTSKKTQADFIFFARKYVRDRRDVSFETKTLYRGIINKLEDFNPSFTAVDIDREFVIDFKLYLESKVSGNTVKKIMVRFARLYREFCKAQELPESPYLFEDLHIKTTRPKRTFLDESEIQQLKDLQLIGINQLVRDIFIFQCRTGLYYSDVQKLTQKDLKKHPKHGYYLSGERFKNDNPFIIPLWIYPEPVEILEKYKGEKGQLFIDLPHVDDYNAVLKHLAFTAGIDKPVTNKVARHTMADLMIMEGYPRAFIATILGHSKEETTSEYFKLHIQLLADGIDQFRKSV